MGGQGFDDFVTEHATTVAGVVQLITDDLPVTHEVVDGAWLAVYARWPDIRQSPRPLALALAEFVARATRRAKAAESATAGRGQGATALELRDDVSFGAAPLRGGSRESLAPQGDDDDPADLAVAQAFADLAPRERALVALSVYAGLDDRSLPWAVRWRPPRAAKAMRRAHRELMLTAAPQVIGPTGGVDAARSFEDRVRRVLGRIAAAAEGGSQTKLTSLRPRLASVTQRRARPRPRPALLIGVGAALAAAVAAGVLTATHDASRSVVEASGLPSPPTGVVTGPVLGATAGPTAEPGMRLVGFHTVYTSVPASWTHNHLGCGKALGSTVIYPDASDICSDGLRGFHDVHPSSVTFSAASPKPPVRGRLRQVNEIGGYDVFADMPTAKGQLIKRVVVIPKAAVMMVVRTTDESVMDKIVDSLQPIPRGFVVVPPCQGVHLRTAIGLLDRAGLRVHIFQASTLSQSETVPPVTRQTIASGSVVPAGTTVGLGFPSLN